MPITKNVRLTYYSSMKKNFRKIRMIFDLENSLWKSNFRTLLRAGKASQDTYNPAGWLILKALLKNGVEEGVASDLHDTKCIPYLMQGPL